MSDSKQDPQTVDAPQSLTQLTATVGIQVEAYLATAKKDVLPTRADFSELPYPGSATASKGNLYTGNTVDAKPFGTSDLTLQEGLHLHWMLPKALAKSVGIQVVQQPMFFRWMEPIYLAAGGEETKWSTDRTTLWNGLVEQGFLRAIPGTDYASVLPEDQEPVFQEPVLQRIAPEAKAFLNRPLADQYPPVPDLWYVARSGGKEHLSGEQWIVESAAIMAENPVLEHPAARTAANHDFVPTVPFLIDPNGSGQPFRYVGKTWPVADWTPGDYGDDSAYLQELTALGYNPQANASGYGEPSFAAFYPNCLGIFGFYDWNVTSDADFDSENPITYDVIGLYTHAKNDYLYLFIQDYFNRNTRPVGPQGSTERQINISQKHWVEVIQSDGSPAQKAALAKATTKQAIQQVIQEFISGPSSAAAILQINVFFNQELQAAIQDEFGWDLEIPEDATYNTSLTLNSPAPTVVFAQRTLCAARLQLTGDASTPSAEDLDVELALGNTPSEALSAYLASKITGTTQSPAATIEEQLEAVQMSSKLQGQLLDLGPTFEDLRHSAGFTASPGGTIWEIRTESETGENHQTLAAELDLTLAELLNETNVVQQQLDAQLEELTSLRRNLFADWYKFLDCEVNFQSSGSGGTPPVDAQGEAGRGVALPEGGPPGHPGHHGGAPGHPPHGKPPHIHDPVLRAPSEVQRYLLQVSLKRIEQNDQEAVVLGQQLEEALEALQQAIHQQNTKLHGVKLLLASQAGARYWVPNDPVILFAGPGLQNLAYVLTTAALTPAVAQVSVALSPLDSKTFEAIDGAIPWGTGKQQIPPIPWHGYLAKPFLLEWQIGLDPEAGGNIPAKGHQDFPATFMEDTFALQETHTDFVLREGVDPVAGRFLQYRGETYLSPSSGMNFAETLDSYLASWMQGNLAEQYYAANNIPKNDQNLPWLLQHLQTAPREGQPAFVPWVQAEFKGQYDDSALDKPNLSPSQRLESWLVDNLQILVPGYLKSEPSWYQNDPANVDHFLGNLLHAQQLLAQTRVLTQSLGGLNRGLAMQQEERQVPVADPVHAQDTKPLNPGGPTNLAFAQAMAWGVQRQNSFTPLVDNELMPIRNGEFSMKIPTLVLADNFGIVYNSNAEAIEAVSSTLTLTSDAATLAPSETYPITLPPRLSQPARLDFRWLSAFAGEQEMNSHPASNPICGWLIPNILDHSLMVYDQGGDALGSITINPDFPWQPAPDSDASVRAVGSIENPYLRTVVRTILAEQLASVEGQTGPYDPTQTYLYHLGDTIDSALAHIDPADFAEHQDLALLMGRPVAVARVRMGLEYRGLGPYDLSWAAFDERIDAMKSSSYGPKQEDDNPEFANLNDKIQLVEFSVRIGESSQLHDGLVGYWKEGADHSLGSTFYSPMATEGASPPSIQSCAQNACNIPLTLGGTPLDLTLLLDPRGAVHVTSGILPTSELQVPPDYYRAALGRMAVTFLVAPILSPVDEVRLPLPSEPGYQWSWLSNDGEGGFTEIPQSAVVSEQVFVKKVPGTSKTEGRSLWTTLLSSKVALLEQTQPGWASVVPKDQRQAGYQALMTALDLTPQEFAPVQNYLERFFDVYAQAINPTVRHARFDDPQMAREGWLKLSPNPLSKPT